MMLLRNLANKLKILRKVGDFNENLEIFRRKWRILRNVGNFNKPWEFLGDIGKEKN